MKRVPFYPLCVGALVLLSLYASNTDQASFRDLIVPMSLVLGLTLALLAITTVAMRSAHRAAILVAAIVFCFMTYGYWVAALWTLHPDPRLRVGYHRGVLVLQAALLALVAYGVVRRVKDPRKLTGTLNWFACIIFTCPLLLIAAQAARAGWRATPATAAPTDPSRLIAKLDPSAGRPDIYFIILDAHGRQDILRDQYGYDDSAFVRHLRDRGFYVADQSTSNYMWTELSVPSTVNLRYLNDLSGTDNEKLEQSARLLHDSALVAELKSVGYRTVAFEAMEPWLCLDNFDVYYKISNQVGFTPLQQLILDTSALCEFGGNALKSRLILDQYHLKREMMLYKLAQAPRAAALAGPKFVFLHMMEPHTPFVFAADGSDPAKRGYGSIYDGLNAEVTDQQYHQWYRQQAIYTDNSAARMIDEILARSAAPPVIVLIGDHGPRSGMRNGAANSNLPECMSNLTAVLLPGKQNRGLYPQITPVNLFRVVLNDYFNARLPLLPDKSYYSYPLPFELEDVTAVVKPSAGSAAAGRGNRL